MPDWQKEHHDLVRNLGRDVTGKVVAHQFTGLTPKFQDLPEVLSNLKIVRQEIAHHARDFLPQEAGQPQILVRSKSLDPSVEPDPDEEGLEQERYATRLFNSR